jgi:hypothetical protein
MEDLVLVTLDWHERKQIEQELLAEMDAADEATLRQRQSMRESAKNAAKRLVLQMGPPRCVMRRATNELPSRDTARRWKP